MMRRLPRIVGAYLAACAAGGFAIALALVLLALLEPLLQGRWPAVYWRIAGRTAGAWHTP